jgi:hypothetical protein
MVDSLYRVTGKVENLGQYDAMDVSLVVTLYGEDQRVTGFRKTILPQRLLAGASTDFDISFSSGGLGVHHHTVTVTGRIDKTSD